VETECNAPDFELAKPQAKTSDFHVTLLLQRYNLTVEYFVLFNIRNKQHNTRELTELPQNYINRVKYYLAP
jgi:hypothetical protein